MYSVTQQCDRDFGFPSRALRCGENGEEEMSVAEERFNGSVTSSRNQRSWVQERQRGKKCRHPFLTSSSLVSLPFSFSYSSIPYTHEGEGGYVLVGDLSGSRLSPLALLSLLLLLSEFESSTLFSPLLSPSFCPVPGS